ncbi:DUF262 domain-containing protein [uncultured Chryseobacterium sp.]|uniref:DUF262 domain-containing protein n=1 Tax=uncultured Chryseobacterium sp. TaxID=259322 RepID=UPI002620C425|nr:DUF262 domain-containing protein [uncultured Chryseobacterium sp.]
MLYDTILQKRENYRTDSYSMSIGELMNMYKNNQLKTNPLYQRKFRWSNDQKSRLIESVLLEIPIPSIFIYQDRSQWEVIDGLQRLSTIFQFVGILEDDEGENIESFKIENVKTLKEINNLGWEEFDEDTQFDFTKTKIEVKIIKDTSSEKSKAKFELFQRINQKPTILSGQEYRNALFIMYDENIYRWVENLSIDDNFKSCISGLEERWINEQYDKELVLRLFIFPKYDLKSKIKKVDDYLDNSIFYDENDNLLAKIVDGSFDLDLEKNKFKKTFELLNECYGEDVFKRKSGRSGQQFLESYYEAIAIGLYYNIDDYSKDDYAYIKQKIDDLDEQEEFKNAKGTGTNTEIRIRRIIPFAKEYFKK